MAIKIDLLPGYVRLARQRNLAIGVSAVVLIIAGSALAVLQEQKRLELQTLTADRNMYEEIAKQTTESETRTAATLALAAPYLGAVDFMSAATKTGPERAALLNLVRQYIYGNSLIKSIDISDGAKVNITATVRDPEEYARFLFTLRQASDEKGGLLFAGKPTASGPKGFGEGARPFILPQPDPNGQPIVILYPIDVTAQGNLKNPVVLPTDPVGGATPNPGQPGAPTFPGGPTP
jgi:hypothetical protein